MSDFQANLNGCKTSVETVNQISQPPISHSHNMSLLLEAIDSLDWLIRHQQLINMAIEESEKFPGNTGDRVYLLLDNYQSRSQCFLEDISQALEQLRQSLPKTYNS